ncbi:aromatic amino acid lyase, partial [Acinetobacter baumannii]
MTPPIRLDGRSLTRAQLVAVARGAPVELDERQLPAVARAAAFLAEQVRREEPIYGVSTGFGSNADRLLGAHRVRDALPGAPAADE